MNINDVDAVICGMRQQQEYGRVNCSSFLDSVWQEHEDNELGIDVRKLIQVLVYDQLGLAVPV